MVDTARTLIRRLGEKVEQAIEQNEQVREWLTTIERIDLDGPNAGESPRRW